MPVVYDKKAFRDYAEGQKMVITTAYELSIFRALSSLISEMWGIPVSRAVSLLAENRSSLLI